MLTALVERYELIAKGKARPESYDEELFEAFYKVGLSQGSYVELVHEYEIDLGDLEAVDYVAMILAMALSHDQNIYGLPVSTNTH